MQLLGPLKWQVPKVHHGHLPGGAACGDEIGAQRVAGRLLRLPGPQLDLGRQFGGGHHRVVHLAAVDDGCDSQLQRLQDLFDEEVAGQAGWAILRLFRGHGDDRALLAPSGRNGALHGVDLALDTAFHLQRNLPVEVGCHLRLIAELHVLWLRGSPEIGHWEVRMVRVDPDHRQLHRREDFQTLGVQRIEAHRLQQGVVLPDSPASQCHFHLAALARP
mmetsp:Transcript_98978/g.236184  ORF Transcript_98978/g.236184 Transcript_98978/m.236184 type:complete len:218 (+) Transcript_98978:2795-3448(+)